MRILLNLPYCKLMFNGGYNNQRHPVYLKVRLLNNFLNLVDKAHLADVPVVYIQTFILKMGIGAFIKHKAVLLREQFWMNSWLPVGLSRVWLLGC